MSFRYGRKRPKSSESRHGAIHGLSSLVFSWLSGSRVSLRYGERRPRRRKCSSGTALDDQNERKCRSGTVKDDKSYRRMAKKKIEKSQEILKMSLRYGERRPILQKCSFGTVKGDQEIESVVPVRSKTTKNVLIRPMNVILVRKWTTKIENRSFYDIFRQTFLM